MIEIEERELNTLKNKARRYDALVLYDIQEWEWYNEAMADLLEEEHYG